MDIISIATTLFKLVQKNPQILSALAEHPYSTTKEECGISEDISKTDMSQIITMVAGLLGGGSSSSLDMGTLASVASGLMSDNGDSNHALASALLGTAASSAANASSDSGVDLTDGLDLSDIMGLAGKLFG